MVYKYWVASDRHCISKLQIQFGGFQKSYFPQSDQFHALNAWQARAVQATALYWLANPQKDHWGWEQKLHHTRGRVGHRRLYRIQRLNCCQARRDGRQRCHRLLMPAHRGPGGRRPARAVCPLWHFSALRWQQQCLASFPCLLLREG